MIKNIIRKKLKASAIVITFFVMMMILTIALSLAAVTIKDMKGSIGSAKSGIAYQAADEGIEDVMNDILKNGKNKISELNNCKSDGLIRNAANTYIVELLDESDEKINCQTQSNDNIATIIKIKSIGISENNAQKSERAVEVPVSCKTVYNIDSDDTDTVGLWHFEETSGTENEDYLKDSSYYHNNADPEGTKVARGVCNARSFNGSSDYIDAGNNSSLQITGKITLSAWVNMLSFPSSSWAYIVGKGYDGANEGYFLRLNNTSGTLKLETGSFASAGSINYMVPWNVSGWNTNEWHYIVGEYDGTNWNLYFDGSLKQQSPQSQGALSSSSDVYIGAANIAGTMSRYINAIIDEIWISKEAKDSGEIKCDFCAGCKKVYPPNCGSTNCSSCQ